MPRAKQKREKRLCVCGCGEIFFTLPNSEKRYAPTCRTIRNPSVTMRPDVIDAIRKSKMGENNPNWKPKDIRACECGCGETFQCNPSSRRRFVNVAHSKRGENNPMKRPEVARKCKEKMPDGGWPKSPEGLANIAAAARERMLSNRNPFNNPRNATAWLKSQHPTMTPSESEFAVLCKDAGFDIVFTGNGDLWIGKKCPDFLIKETNIVIEITKRILKRNLYTYENVRRKHFESYGYQCVVVWANNKSPYFDKTSVIETLQQALRQSPLVRQH